MTEGMSYQLVLQFPGDSLASYDAVIALEDKLIVALGESATVDGHDCGQGEVNIFVLINDVIDAFKRTKPLLLSAGDQSSLRAAYRELNNDRFTVIWPEEFAGEFTVR